MLIKRACATICGIPSSRGLFLEPSALWRLMLPLIVLLMPDIHTDDDGKKSVGEPSGSSALFYA